jgi:hypothetical protein
MKILEIKDIIRKDVPLYYKRFYTGVAVVEIIDKSQDLRVDFSIEHKPTGQKEILVTLTDQIDYPLAPISTALKKTINEMDSSGRLPD